VDDFAIFAGEPETLSIWRDCIAISGSTATALATL
jgi:hypothetical protein